MDDGILSVQDLFWLEQEELDSTDNFFLPADTPPDCPKAYQHRKRMCIEGYDRMLIRLIQEQTKEMNDLRSSIGQLVDESLLPPKPPPSLHHYIYGKNYARNNQGVIKQAIKFLMEKGDVVEDYTSSVQDMVVMDDAASTYKKDCQNILDNATRMLRLKHQRQRNQILIQSGDALQKLIDEQSQEVDPNERTVPVQQQLQQPEPTQEQQQLQQIQQLQPQQLPQAQQQEQPQHQQQEEQQQPQQQQPQQQQPQQQQSQQQHLQQQQHIQYQQWQQQQQQQQTPIIHSINVSRDPRIRPGYNTAPRK